MPASLPTLVFEESRVDAIFEEFNHSHLPGVAVGIAIDGKPVYRKGFGLASVDLPFALTPSIRMRIGSTSKQFSAFAYMMLCEQGRAQIDDTIGKHLPKLHHNVQSVTMQQLMGNISGLPDATDVVQQFSGKGRTVTSSDILSFYEDVADLNAAPGTTYIYNNGGWVIISAVIESITGKSLEEALEELVFRPTGMNDTRVRRSDFNFVPNSASPHAIDGKGHFIRLDNLSGIDCAGAGAIVTTVDDMLRWMANMDRGTVGSERTWAAMKTPQSLANGTFTGYGLGLETIAYRGIETLQHAGGADATNAQMLKVPDLGLDIICMMNRSPLEKLAAEYVDRILDESVRGLTPVRHESASAPCAVGVYQSPSTGRVAELLAGSDVEWDDGTQVISLDGHHIPFAADGNAVYRPVGNAGFIKCEVQFVGDPVTPSSIRVKDFGNRDELFRVNAPNADDFGVIAGQFRSDATGTDATVSLAESGPQIRFNGRFGSVVHKLRHLSENIWRTTPTDPLILPMWGMVVFDQDKTTFKVCNFLNRNVRFRRTA